MQTDTICLGLLSTGPKSGYEIKQIFEGPLSDMYSLSYGTIYPTLNKLMDEKYVSCKQHSQDKKPDKKVYTISKKGIRLLNDNLITDATNYLRSKNFGDQIKSEFFLILLFSKNISSEIIQTVINQRISFFKQRLELIKYEGPLPPELKSIRDEKASKFIRGLASELIETGLRYMEKNKGMLGK
tara:strand:+ start:257 stop:808 length:552 start_codon:yes stop_codon:yes gene_type:complete